MKPYKIICTILFLFYPLWIFCQNGLQYGLYFSSHEVIQDKRTSLNLTPHGPFNISGNFSIEFEAEFRRGDGYYGYIFRLLADNETNIDLVSNLAAHDSNFWLVYKENTLISFNWSQLQGVDYNKWVKIRVDIDGATSSISLSINGNKKEVRLQEDVRMQKSDIVFGAVNYRQFVSTDVCPMSLRNIKIYNDGREEMFWELSKHINNLVYDSISGAEAVVENPVWIIDRHVKWAKIKDFRIKNLAGSAYDKKNRRIFFVNDKEIHSISMDTFVTDTIPYSGNQPYKDELSRQIVYNGYNNQLWSYDFSSDTINYFDFEQKKWSVAGLRTVEALYAHQNKFISPVDSSLVSILGYGLYRYSGQVRHYNRKNNSWETIDRSDQIEPRYLSGTSLADDNKVLVFGGYGSKTGRQELSPKFYYDLYQFDFNDFSFNKLWTLPAPESPFVPCQSLVFDKEAGCFYTLVYNRAQFNTYLKLGRFGIDNTDYTFYNDSIPYNFLDTESWADLILDSKKQILIAYTVYKDEISIYSMAYPPLLRSDILSEQEVKGSSFTASLLWLLIIIPLIPVYILYRGKRVRPADIRVKKPSEPNSADYKDVNPLLATERVLKSSVYLLGGFLVNNNNGVNITSDFSPTLKHLFLFIFLHTVKNPKGVSASKLDDVLWYDKTGQSIRNNRNVNISKLRTVLENTDIELINENKFWRIELKNTVCCDYIDILNIIEEIKPETLTEPEIYRLLGLLLHGEMLPNVHTEWADIFKADFTNEVVDCLLKLIGTGRYTTDYNLKYHIANSILALDTVNEEALIVKCRILFDSGKRAMSKTAYDLFCREYKTMFGEDYKMPFEGILKNSR